MLNSGDFDIHEIYLYCALTELNFLQNSSSNLGRFTDIGAETADEVEYLFREKGVIRVNIAEDFQRQDEVDAVMQIENGLETEKKIACFGAGKALQNFCRAFAGKGNGKIWRIVDNDQNKWGGRREKVRERGVEIEVL